MKRGTVYLEPHQSEWERAAEETISTLKNILGSIAADIQHIGSTSIKTISAKPIIDIAVAVNDYELILSKRDVLEKSNIVFRFDERPEQRLLWAILKRTHARIISMWCFTALMNGITISTSVII